VGKSTLMMKIASIVTNGDNWPFSEDQAEKGSVVWITGEESIDQILKPRSVAAGCDASKLYFVESVARASRSADGKNVVADEVMRMSQDAKQLLGLKKSLPDLRLVVVDPISAFLDAADSHRESDVRQIFLPWIQAAEEAEIAIIFVAHFNKGSGGNIRDKLSGSSAIRNAVRSVFVMMDDPDDIRNKLFLVDKNNLADDNAPGLVVEIVSEEWREGASPVPCVKWVKETNLKAQGV
jgi:putative DNA primase/helicase